jgi:hypothetical protein
VAHYHYGIGPWVWNASEACWQPPDGAVCALDLRSIPDAGRDTLGTQPYGFFAAQDALSGDYAALGVGDCRELASSGAMRDAWESLLGYRPSGPTLLDLLWDHLTNGADPTGEDRCKPLLPTMAGTLDVHLPGHSLVRRETFTRTHPHWNQVAALHQADLARMVAEYESLGRGKGANEAARLRQVPEKVLGGLCQQYRIDFADAALLLPPSLRGTLTARKPETTIGDSFDRANDADLNASDTGKTLNGSAGTWDWADVLGTEGAINTNQMRATFAASGYGTRAEQDLSSANHRTTATRCAADDPARNAIVYARFSASAHTGYQHVNRSTGTTTYRLFKIINSVQTQIGSTVNATAPSLPFTFAIEADGSSISALAAGSVVNGPVTDTAITGNVRAGLGASNIGLGGNYVALDDFLAEDLATVSPRTGHLTLMGVA